MLLDVGERTPPPDERRLFAVLAEGRPSVLPQAKVRQVLTPPQRKVIHEWKRNLVFTAAARLLLLHEQPVSRLRWWWWWWGVCGGSDILSSFLWRTRG